MNDYKKSFIEKVDKFFEHTYGEGEEAIAMSMEWINEHADLSDKDFVQAFADLIGVKEVEEEMTRH